MKGLLKVPGEPGKLVEFNNSIEKMQELVGGYMEAMFLESGVVALFDEDARMKGSSVSCELNGVTIRGNCLFLSSTGNNFSSIDIYGIQTIDNFDVDLVDYRVCPACGEIVARDDMLYTKDCHGVPMRLLCNTCRSKVMSDGYDGVPYVEE